jgi:hypothetical protein
MIILCLLFTVVISQNSIPFDKYFENATLRIDYNHIADSESDIITIDKLYRQGIWAGSKKNLIDRFNQGRYYIKILDADSKKLIFSKGFDSYCGEYKTSGPASRGIKRTYHESALIPFPKNDILFTIEMRDRQNKLQPLFSQEIIPDSVYVVDGDWLNNVKVYDAHVSGEPNSRVDLAIVGEGYTMIEQYKFVKDLKYFTDILLNYEPYKSHKDKFNIYGVLRFSEESGTDEPRANIYRSTAVNTTFNSMGSERYLLTEDNKSLRDIAAHVPYDALLIMINHERYGGGGIYNSFLTFTSDNQWKDYVFVHEFGHSFAGLADEYYTSSTAYNEFYPRGIEPTEPNITALLDKKNVKWKSFLSKKIEVPTPWEKADFDSMDVKYQKIRTEVNDKVARLKRERATQEEIEAAEAESKELSLVHAKRMDKYLQNSKFFGKVGVFEGAGYSAKGLYRPMIDCIMFTKGEKPFCKVCENAIIQVIKHYSE